MERPKLEEFRKQRTLTLQVPDELYQAIARDAQASGRTTEDLAAEWLARTSDSASSEQVSAAQSAQSEKARGRVRGHFGVWDSGDERSANIDCATL